MPDSQYRFGGFAEPNFTQTPDVFFDEIAPNLTEAELRCLIYIIRRTFGFKKRNDDISLKQLVDGITTRDGRVLDRGTGMSKSAVVRGLSGLVEKGVIVAHRNASPEKGNLPTTYALHFATDPLSSETTRGVPPKGHPLVLPDDPQQTVEQETEEQEDFEFEAYIRDFAREFRDSAPIQSSVTRAHNIFTQWGGEVDDFIPLLYEARARTKKATNVKARMPYFFAALEDLCGTSS